MRIDSELKRIIEENAQKEYRSVNSMIEYMLAKSVGYSRNFDKKPVSAIAGLKPAPIQGLGRPIEDWGDEELPE